MKKAAIKSPKMTFAFFYFESGEQKHMKKNHFMAGSKK